MRRVIIITMTIGCGVIWSKAVLSSDPGVVERNSIESVDKNEWAIQIISDK